MSENDKNKKNNICDALLFSFFFVNRYKQLNCRINYSWSEIKDNSVPAGISQWNYFLCLNFKDRNVKITNNYQAIISHIC